MSRALNLSLTMAQVDRHCRDNGVAISTLEALPDGGARLVCMSNYGAAQIRSKLKGHIIEGKVRRVQFRPTKPVWYRPRQLINLHPSKRVEAIVSAENWHEERDRLLRLLKAIESGKITHIDEEDQRQLQATSPENIVALKERLAELNERLGVS